MNRERKPPAFLTIFFVFLFLVSAGQSVADEVVIENGDKLTGTIVKIEGGKLILKTDYAGSLEIPIEKIKNIVTDKESEVHLTSGEILKGKLKTAEGGTLVIDPGLPREPATVDFKNVASVNPPPKIPPRWKGAINLGGSVQTGNTSRTTASVGAAAARKTDDDRFNLRFLFNYAEEKSETTTRNTYGALKYDYFFTKKLYGYLGVELLIDEFKDLNLRATAGPGLGYQIWDDPVKSFLVEAGISYVWEDRKIGEDNNWATARLSADFSYKFGKYITFSDLFIIYPNLKRSGEYTLRNEAALTSPLGAGWALRLANIWERDSDPSPGILKDDLTWLLTLQYSF
jgi:putative salt-induced outer membrane protein YdiY